MTESLTGENLDSAGDCGLDTQRLRSAFRLLAAWVDEGVLPAAAAVIARGGTIAGEMYVGHATDQAPASQSTLWHWASNTKPVTAAAVMSLVERGVLDLDEPLGSYVPEFLTWTLGLWRERVTLRHVLAHCSGLPGFGRENVALRRAHRPLCDFVRPFGSEPLVFEPGTLHYYSNCGILMAAEVVARAVSGSLRRQLPEPAVSAYHPFVKSALLDPLDMSETTFSPDEGFGDRVAHVRGVSGQAPDWEMSNSAYYRSLGIPWGGLYGTARDLAKFVDAFLPASGGRSRLAGGARVLSAASVAAMTSVQFAPPDAPASLAPELRDGAPPEPPRPAVSWGIGWSIKGTERPHRFGSLTSAATFGHLGAGGTMAWADPTRDLLVILLTNQALATGWAVDVPRLALFSNAVVGALA